MQDKQLGGAGCGGRATHDLHARCHDDRAIFCHDALVGQSAVPCALFALGAALSFYAIDGVLGRALVIVAIKNVLLPLLVWGVSIRLGLPPVWQAVMVVMAALPVGINTYLFAERYECGQALAGTAVVVSTAVSVITLSVVLSILA